MLVYLPRHYLLPTGAGSCWSTHCGTAHYGTGLSTRSGWRSAYAKALCPPMEWPASTWFGLGLGLGLGLGFGLGLGLGLGLGFGFGSGSGSELGFATPNQRVRVRQP